MVFPKEHWPQRSSTNPLERLHKEIKRRSRVVEISPNDGAVVRLLGTLLSDQTGEWQVTRRYLRLLRGRQAGRRNLGPAAAGERRRATMPVDRIASG